MVVSHVQAALALGVLVFTFSLSQSAHAHGQDEERALVASAGMQDGQIVLDVMVLYELPAGPRASLLRAQYGMVPGKPVPKISAALLGASLWGRMSTGLQVRLGAEVLKPVEHKSHAKPGPRGGILVASFLSYHLPADGQALLEFGLAPKSLDWPLRVRFALKDGVSIAQTSHPVVSKVTGIGDLELSPGASLSLLLVPSTKTE